MVERWNHIQIPGPAGQSPELGHPRHQSRSPLSALHKGELLATASADLCTVKIQRSSAYRSGVARLAGEHVRGKFLVRDLEETLPRPGFVQAGPAPSRHGLILQIPALVLVSALHEAGIEQTISQLLPAARLVEGRTPLASAWVGR
jgi:hypothetical protein